MKKEFVAIIIVFVIGLAGLCSPVTGQMENQEPENKQAEKKPPYEKETILKVLRLGGITPKEMIQRIEERGVYFELISSTEIELLEAGATPELMRAIRANYRAERDAERELSQGAAQPTGPPNDFSYIKLLVENGMNPKALLITIKREGVNFMLTQAGEQELRKLGATSEHIAAIRANFRASLTPEGPAATAPPIQSEPRLYTQQDPSPSPAQKRFERVVTAAPVIDPIVSGEWDCKGLLSDVSDPRKTLSISFRLNIVAEKVSEGYATVTGEFTDETGTYKFRQSEWRYDRQLTIVLEEERIVVTGTYEAGGMKGIISMPVGDRSWSGNWEGKKRRKAQP
jgi:hypothetical protein